MGLQKPDARSSAEESTRCCIQEGEGRRDYLENNVMLQSSPDAVALLLVLLLVVVVWRHHTGQPFVHNYPRKQRCWSVKCAGQRCRSAVRERDTVVVRQVGLWKRIGGEKTRRVEEESLLGARNAARQQEGERRERERDPPLQWQASLLPSPPFHAAVLSCAWPHAHPPTLSLCMTCFPVSFLA